MKKYLIFFIIIPTLALYTFQCGSGTRGLKDDKSSISDDSLLTLIQHKTFQYFWDGAEPNSGLARERYHMDDIYPHNDKNVVTSGGGGFGLMAILVGIERGFISREDGIQRLTRIAGFLENADRFHGAWSHWINGESGKVVPFSKNDNGGDIVETAYMAQALITVYEYFKNGTVKEQELAERMDKLWKGIEWSWYQNGQDVLFWHWSPDLGWEMNHKITGYNECLITYVMGASSPEYPISPEAYHKGWARNGDIKGGATYYGLPLELDHRNTQRGGPLFWEHYSYLGLNPKNLKDRYADYWRHNRNHVLINRQYCIENPNGFKGYGEDCWGLTSSYSIRDYQKILKAGGTIPDFEGKDIHEVGYAGHKPDRDFSVIAPTAALSSFPYAPKECMKVARFFYDELGDKLMGQFGFYDAFSMEYDWFPQKYLAIDQGPIVIMIENYRSGLLWKLFMNNEDIKHGLDRLGFTYE